MLQYFAIGQSRQEILKVDSVLEHKAIITD